jgi:hypothetical protein
MHEMNLDRDHTENGGSGSGNLVLNPNGHASWGMNNTAAQLGTASSVNDVDVPFDKIGSLRLPTVVVFFSEILSIFGSLKSSER